MHRAYRWCGTSQCSSTERFVCCAGEGSSEAGLGYQLAADISLAKIKEPASSKQSSSWETFMARRAKMQAELDQGAAGEL